MQETPEKYQPSQFAGLLATLAGTAPRRDSASWVDEALEDDVAVLSYEQALRAQSRRRPEESIMPPSAASPPSAPPAPEAPPASRTDTFAGAVPTDEAPAKESLYQLSLKTASVTIRMSQAESLQLHRRAAEAGLTVSAYLRSCAFEVESLRHLVKETMAQLKQANARAQVSEAHTEPSGWLYRLGRWLWPSRHDGHPASA